MEFSWLLCCFCIGLKKTTLNLHRRKKKSILKKLKGCVLNQKAKNYVSLDMTLFIIAFHFLFSSFLSEPSETVSISLQVRGMERVAGTLRMGIYDSDQTFAKEGKQWKGVVVKVEGKSQTIKIDLPKGKKIGIAIFHDANGNGVMDKNMMGIPTENYGFSNNARATFSAPSFADASIFVKDDATFSILLK